MTLSYLLDVNVLIALLDENHDFHDVATTWFHNHGKNDWSSCPITENGALRVMSNSRYPNRPGGPQDILALLGELKDQGSHVFWSNDVSFSNPSIFDLRQITNANDLTDIYLLGLARSKDGKLATFDKRIRSEGAIDGLNALYLINIWTTPQQS